MHDNLRRDDSDREGQRGRRHRHRFHPMVLQERDRKREHDQVEGYCQNVLPRRLLISPAKWMVRGESW